MEKSTREDFQAWLRMWNERIVHIDDVARAVEELIAKSSDVTFFLEAPPEIQQTIRADLESYRKNGSRKFIVPGSSLEFDLSKEMNACNSHLQKAGLL